MFAAFSGTCWNTEKRIRISGCITCKAVNFHPFDYDWAVFDLRIGAETIES